MRRRNLRRELALLLSCAAGVAALAAGCRSVTPAGASGLPDTVTDPCAERLHEICGHLLAYYARQESLPPDLEALRAETEAELSPLVSPGSEDSYVYHQPSLELPGRPGRLLMHDPVAPKESATGQALRWAVLVSEPQGARQLSLQVVLIPKSEIAAALARRAAGRGP